MFPSVQFSSVAQSCPTLCDPMDCSPGSSVHRILQGRILKWVAVPFSGFPGGSDGKASVYNEGDPASIPGLGRSAEEGNGNPLQYFGHLMRRVDSLEKTLMVGGIGGKRRRG